MKFIYVLAIVGVAVVGVLDVQAVILKPAFDTQGRSTETTLNKTDTGNLAVGPVAANDYFRTYLTFDLTTAPSNAGTVSLTLQGSTTLTENNTQSGAQVFTLFQLSSDWNGVAVPGPNGTALATATITISSGDDVKDISFQSDALKDAFNAASGGMLYLGVKSDVEGVATRTFKWFNSVEDGSTAPLLSYTREIPVTVTNGQVIVRVADAGAVPDDGLCDASAIREAIAAVEGQTNVVVEFDAGVYNLKESGIEVRSGERAMIYVWGQTNWTLRGAVDPAGDPATVLEMNLTLKNQTTGASHFDIRNNAAIAVENIVLDQNPRFCTAGEVISVDTGSNQVQIDIFEGMPHFNGMMSFSANNWDLTSRHLIRGPAVTIGLTSGEVEKWYKVAGYDRRYKLTSTAIAPLVQVGQGLSFHFQVLAPEARTIDLFDCTDVRFENIFVYNIIHILSHPQRVRNLTFRRVHLKPEGNSLAVGPRDGVHISLGNTGTFLMEDSIFAGLRWDPLVSYMRFVSISERVDNYTLRLDGSDAYHSSALAATAPGSVWRFFAGNVPTTGVVSTVNGGTVTFTAPLDASVTAGKRFAPSGWLWDEAVIRRSLFQDNYGTPIVWENNNLTVEHCLFRHNAYDNIGLGPSSAEAGVFAQNIVIRNNIFEDSTWSPKHDDYRGTIITQSESQYFSTQKYHRNILIEKNLFRNIYGSWSNPSAIQIKNAGDVVIRNNRYENVERHLLVESTSTENIVQEGLQISRCTGSSMTVNVIPTYLDGATLVTFPRGTNVAVPAFSFESTNALTVYMAVHDNGTPTIPAEWTAQADKVKWQSSTAYNASQYKDTIYRRDFAAGTVDIPGHNGFASTSYGVPHMLFLFTTDGKGGVSTNGFSSSPMPSFFELDPYLLWTGDDMSPLTWAAEVGWEDGTALSVFQGYLLNRRDLDSKFLVEGLTIGGDGHVELRWPADGFPNGDLTMRASESLRTPSSEWPVLTGTLTYTNGSTFWRSATPLDVLPSVFLQPKFK